MKEIFILEVKLKLVHSLTPAQLESLDHVLRNQLEGKEVYDINVSVNSSLVNKCA